MSTRNLSRKEERIEASIDYQMSTNPIALGGAAHEDMIRKMNVNYSFVEGAEWADKTMLDKVCKWLKEYIGTYNDTIYSIHGTIKIFNKEKFIEDLRKAMEK